MIIVVQVDYKAEAQAPEQCRKICVTGHTQSIGLGDKARMTGRVGLPPPGSDDRGEGYCVRK